MWNHPFICVLNTVAVRGVCLTTLPAYRTVETSLNRPQKLDQKSSDWEVGFFVAKYSFEFKMGVVQAYLNGEVKTSLNILPIHTYFAKYTI